MNFSYFVHIMRGRRQRDKGIGVQERMLPPNNFMVMMTVGLFQLQISNNIIRLSHLQDVLFWFPPGRWHVWNKHFTEWDVFLPRDSGRTQDVSSYAVRAPSSQPAYSTILPWHNLFFKSFSLKECWWCVSMQTKTQNPQVNFRNN